MPGACNDNSGSQQRSFVPLYSQTQEKLNKPNCNFSLFSPRMVPWSFSGNEIAVDKSAISTLYEQSKKSFPGTKKLLEAKAKRQNDYIDSLKNLGLETFTFKVRTASPFITGLGSGHPTETGMILDRNIGIPYIPASSIKGVLRLACAINLAREIPEYAKTGVVPDDNETLVKYFGTMTQDAKSRSRGRLMFFDAYPEKIPVLKMDILNPHFSNYYSGKNKQPLESETPIPVSFLVVKEETPFTFNCAFIPLQDEKCSTDEITAMFKTAFEEVGFGGKTAIGYGRFKSK